MCTDKKYTIIKNVMSDTAARNAYNRLATDTFGLSFENWYNLTLVSPLRTAQRAKYGTRLAIMHDYPYS